MRQRSNALDLGRPNETDRLFDSRELELIAAADPSGVQPQVQAPVPAPTPAPILFQLPEYCKDSPLKKHRDDPDEPENMRPAIQRVVFEVA